MLVSRPTHFGPKDFNGLSDANHVSTNISLKKICIRPLTSPHIIREMLSVVFALLRVGAYPRSVSEPGWVWWTPPVQVSQLDRLGRSCDQILKMGWDSWNGLCEQPGGSPLEEKRALAYRVDGPETVWGACLAQRNDRIMSKLPNALSTRDRELRTHMFRFGMACVGLVDSRDRGGTSSNHQPKAMWDREEEALFEILTNQPRRRISSKEERTMQKRLARFTSISTSPGSAQIQLRNARIGKFSSLARAELFKINLLVARLRPAIQSDAVSFEQDSIGLADPSPEHDSDLSGADYHVPHQTSI
jgi:hypothetical protein